MSFRKTADRFLRTFESKYATHNHIEISRSALLHNLLLFKDVAQKDVIPVLKGNAYGHGIEQVARALAGLDIPYIAVDGYFEALRVREVSKIPVLIMGSILPANFRHIKYDRFAFIVHTLEVIRALGKTGKRVAVHLECNTGMNRYGAPLQDMAELTKEILKYKNLRLEGVMTHLADSDGEDQRTVDAATELFDRCVEAVRVAGGNPSRIHIAQSAGSMRVTSKYANTIRVGIGLYGVQPFPQGHEAAEALQGLRPALQLMSTITKVIHLKKGEKVSYNYTFEAPKDMKIGVLPVGYYEGVNRALSNQGMVTVGAAIAPIVGRVCMNHMMISLEDIDAQVGDPVVVYSSHPSDPNTVDAVAREFGLFNYGLLTALSPDVRRKLVV